MFRRIDVEVSLAGCRRRDWSARSAHVRLVQRQGEGRLLRRRDSFWSPGMCLSCIQLARLRSILIALSTIGATRESFLIDRLVSLNAPKVPV